MSLEQLQDNWAIILGFVTGIVTWGKTVTTVSTQGKENVKLDERVTKIEGEITSIRESAASMAASAEATQRSVDLLLKHQLGG